MRPMRRLLIGWTLILFTAAPAAAGPIGVGLTLSPGVLRVRAAPVTVVGARVSVPVTVADGRGHGAGWTLRLHSSSRVTVDSITARCATGSTCTLPAAAGRPSGLTVLRAAKGTGMGVIDLAVTLSSPTRTTVSFSVG